MKLAIITLPLHTNYGGILQAFALQKVLERMGNQVECIEEKQFNFGLYIPPHRIFDRLKRRIINKEDCYILYERKLKKLSPIIRRNTNDFINKYIHLKKVRSFHSIKKKDYEGFVVGSDQIWRPVFIPKIENAFLGFTQGWNVIRIAYAASFGVSQLEYTSEQLKRCRKAIAAFDRVSVREDDAIEICHKYFGVEASHVLDPTMLLDVSEYRALVNNSGVQKSEGNLFCYILDENDIARKITERMKDDRLFVPFYINAFNGNKKVPLEKRIQPPVESWLRAFIDSEFVLTDSFHATVFSILFHKPFIVCINEGRGLARISSLLKMFNLEDRLVTEENDIFKWKKGIDWEIVDERLEYWRAVSFDFLNFCQI